jgi:hypothetical protein
MARSTTEKRRLIKFSNYSMCITLPKWVIDQLEWKKGDVITLVTDVKDGKITLHRDENASTKAESEVDSNTPEAEAAEPPKLRW